MATQRYAEKPDRCLRIVRGDVFCRTRAIFVLFLGAFLLCSSTFRSVVRGCMCADVRLSSCVSMRERTLLLRHVSVFLFRDGMISVAVFQKATS